MKHKIIRVIANGAQLNVAISLEKDCFVVPPRNDKTDKFNMCFVLNKYFTGI